MDGSVDAISTDLSNQWGDRTANVFVAKDILQQFQRNSGRLGDPTWRPGDYHTRLFLFAPLLHFGKPRNFAHFPAG